jgi:hypothetical protein
LIETEERQKSRSRRSSQKAARGIPVAQKSGPDQNMWTPNKARGAQVDIISESIDNDLAERGVKSARATHYVAADS